MSNKSILLADDHESILASIGWELQRNNFAVTTASNGQEAIDCLRNRQYDLVITDMVMPQVDGMEVLQEAKKLYPDSGVIVLTGYDDTASAVKALKLGADDFLLKPCDIDELLSKANRSFEKQDLLATLQRQNDTLLTEIAAREALEDELKQSHHNLEKQVIKRTAELTATVGKLNTALKELQTREEELHQKNQQLRDMNTTLTVMLNRRDEEHLDIRKEIAAEAAELVMPLLKKAEKQLSGTAQNYLATAQANLRSLFVRHSHDSVLANAKLAPRELQVVNYIKQDKSSKEIAEILDLSVRTVESYREKIRKKLGMQSQKKNLKKFLTSLP
jgi:DNA-binding NarL/FixJ family response regulator